MNLKAIPTQFINAEPATLGKRRRKRSRKVVILAFGGMEGPVHEVAVNLKDAKAMVVDLVGSLAAFGDETAQAIGEQFFSERPE
jgi:hypothetical protein